MIVKMPPKFQKSSSPRVKNGEAEPFSDAPIKSVKTVETKHPLHLREGFVRKLYTTQCGKGGLPGQDKILKKS
jgi:hypothetical protein